MEAQKMFRFRRRNVTLTSCGILFVNYKFGVISSRRNTLIIFMKILFRFVRHDGLFGKARLQVLLKSKNSGPAFAETRIGGDLILIKIKDVY